MSVSWALFIHLESLENSTLESMLLMLVAAEEERICKSLDIFCKGTTLATDEVAAVGVSLTDSA